MSRGSFGRSVARAAASGGSKSYRARPPVLWYASVVVIVLGGIGLAAYSRNERVSSATIGPTATDNWQVAFGIDVCGKFEGNLPANTNLTSVGIRTFGNGLINVDPGAVSSGAAAFEGANATLGAFATNYPGLTLTNTSLSIASSVFAPTTSTTSTTTTTAPKSTTSSKATTTTKAPSTTTTTLPPAVYANGGLCTAKQGPLHGRATLVAETFSSTSAAGQLVTSNLTSIHLSDGEMITLAFVPPGSKIPAPPSKSTLASTLGTSPSGASKKG